MSQAYARPEAKAMGARHWELRIEQLNEQEWLDGSDPDVALAFVAAEDNPTKRKSRPSDRKLRLFGCACCRRIWSLLSPEWAKEAVLVAEAYADDLAGESDLKAAFSKAPASLLRLGSWHTYAVAYAAAATDEDREGRSVWALIAARDVSAPDGGMKDVVMPSRTGRRRGPDARDSAELAAQAVLLRDIYGNPFRPLAFKPEWRTESTVGLALKMYDERDFAAMPVLADALEDAGCTNADILNHCRQPGAHARGCWVLDLILGRQ
jgi:hypothetical protein